MQPAAQEVGDRVPTDTLHISPWRLLSDSAAYAGVDLMLTDAGPAARWDPAARIVYMRRDLSVAERAEALAVCLRYAQLCAEPDAAVPAAVIPLPRGA